VKYVKLRIKLSTINLLKMTVTETTESWDCKAFKIRFFKVTVLIILLQLLQDFLCVSHGHIYIRASSVLYEYYVRYKSSIKCQKTITREFPGVWIPHRNTSQNPLNRVRTTGVLIKRIQKCQHSVLTQEKLNDVRHQLGDSPPKYLSISQLKGNIICR
jgi:hypothetical protein